MHRIKISNITWSFTLLLLFSILPLTSCQPQTPAKSPAENVTENISQATSPTSTVDNISLESGFEIPNGIAPQRAETYDDIALCFELNYRARCPRPHPWNFQDGEYLEVATGTLPGSEFPPTIDYRDNIATKAGQIRYNIFFVRSLDSQVHQRFLRQYGLNGTRFVTYGIKLAEIVPDIQVAKYAEEDELLHTPNTGPDYLFCLGIEVSPQVKPGDYTLHFIIVANGQNCGELPCVIHVIE
ncbi:MAG: hypothetical protein ABSG90_08510 [Dehalococcoidia bacterium]|jgi:hypothetical protein